MLCLSGRKLICGLSACKAHLGIAFFRGTELPDPRRLFSPGGEGNTNLRSLRLTTLDGFDRAALRALLHAAVALDADPTLPPAPRASSVCVMAGLSDTIRGPALAACFDVRAVRPQPSATARAVASESHAMIDRAGPTIHRRWERG